VARADNPGRERILGRIQAALRESAPKHESVDPSAAIFATIEDPLAHFQTECARNNTECVITSDPGAAAASIGEILQSIPPGGIFVQDTPELRRMVLPWLKDRNCQWSSEGGPAENSQATITLAETLVAQTGSVFVSSGCGGRGASVVAPVHVVVASVDQLVPDLSAAFARLRERGAAEKNSMLCLVTGSSRTADIEKILVIGAHGPRRVVVILSLKGIS
jgi:L-lactate dehydrogenase complex protein LldG